MSRAAEIAAGLTESMAVALSDFEPGVWHGVACPTRRAAAHKGHMVRMGLAEHDGPYGGDARHYRLTPLGKEVRQYLQHQDRGE